MLTTPSGAAASAIGEHLWEEDEEEWADQPSRNILDGTAASMC